VIADEGTFVDRQWKALRNLNGDQACAATGGPDDGSVEDVGVLRDDFKVSVVSGELLHCGLSRDWTEIG